MRKKVWIPVLMAALLSSSLTVCAAPQYMADGAVFDPEWYLEQNPDVASGWSLGTSADALYGHYTMHGANEGRKPYNEATIDLSSILPYQGADSTAASDSVSTESTSLKNVPAGKNITVTDTYTGSDSDGEQFVHSSRPGAEGSGCGNGWSRNYKYAFNDGRWVEFNLYDTDTYIDGHAYVSETMDANGVGYCEYKRGANAFVMNMMAAYMAQNPESNFTALMQYCGDNFVVVSANVISDDTYDYDWNYGEMDCESDDVPFIIYMFVNTVFLDEDPAYVAENCVSLFEAIGENYSLEED